MRDEDSLTRRELEILRMVARGLADKEIAAALGASRRRVSNTVSVILLKLGARNRTEAVAEAFRRRILHIDDREDSVGKAPRGEIPGE